ncbi:MAG: molybdenum cofactor guanylyltransferase [Candidatus Neomarinimicrobiota bacterium]|nr:molybdenum cofactor guanylyltransferase [Candidatus Neomarinimicrobiota bacterium]
MIVRTFPLMEKPHPISATAGILIGGRSRRFGSPKWRAEIGGVTILDQLWEKCGDFEEKVVIGKEKPADLDKPFLIDESDIQAPIIGLHTLLKNSVHDWNLLLSCDLPLLTKEVLRKLWKERDENADIIVPEANGRPQVTCALYHRRLDKIVSDSIDRGSFSLTDLADSRNFLMLEMNEVKEVFLNMNTQADWEKIRIQLDD